MNGKDERGGKEEAGKPIAELYGLKLQEEKKRMELTQKRKK